ncbi:MAG: S-layer homology domain-containing protein [Clostridia bacterium]|nr:S-layer homology domain-containing protein [Clostridia bacterium]
MRIKRIAALVLAFALSSGLPVRAAELEAVWSFDAESGMPEGFSFSGRTVTLYNNHVGADGSEYSFGFSAGTGIGMGNGAVTNDSCGVDIDTSSFTSGTNGTIAVSFDFLIENSNLCAWLIAPVADGTAVPLVTLSGGKIFFGETEIGAVEADEWHEVGAEIKKTETGANVSIYLDGVNVGGSGAAYAMGDITGFSVLAAPATSTAEFLANRTFEGRKEILQLDNYYAGINDKHFVGEFRCMGAAVGASLSEFIVTFNRSVSGSIENPVTADGFTIAETKWDELRKTAVVVLNEPMTPGNVYTIRIAEDISCDDGIEYTGKTEYELTAAFPKSINMFWSFDDKKLLPDYFSYNNKNVPTLASDAGESGEAGDYAFTFLDGIGNGFSGPETVLNKYTNGMNILKGDLTAPVNNTTVLFDYDFLLKGDYMLAGLAVPGKSAAAHGFDSAVIVEDGKAVFAGVELGSVEKNEWHNIGVVYKLSSAEGAVIDIYFDSVKKVEGFRDPAFTGGIHFFSVLTTAKVPPEVAAEYPRYDSRNEYMVMDNLYIGDDVSRAIKDLAVTGCVPAKNAAGVAADTGFSVTFNDSVSYGKDELAELISVTDSQGVSAGADHFTVSEDGRTVSAEFPGGLKNREKYTVKFSERLISDYGKAPAAGEDYSFTTGSIFSGKLSDVSISSGGGIVTAEFDFAGSGEAVLVSYDDNGVMTDAGTVSAASGTVSCSGDGENVCLFVVDSLESGILLAEPYISGEAEGGYSYPDTALSFTDVKCKDKLITAEGASSVKNGYIVCKLADNGKSIGSESPEDYLYIGIAKSDSNGLFSFCGKVKEADGEYSYSARALSGSAAEGSVRYKVLDENSLLSMSAGGVSCSISGAEITARISSGTLSGLLVSFELSDGASLYYGNEKLISGTSRLDCSGPVVLKAVSEYGSEREYRLTVTKKTASSDKGGGSGSGGGGGSSYRATVTASAENMAAVKIPEPVETVKSNGFADVPEGFWAADAINRLYEKGIIAGVSESEFAPERSVTREEFAVMLHRAFGKSAERTRTSFDDVAEDAWYGEAVYALADSGIINGTGAHIFGVGSLISRQDMAVMIYRAVQAPEAVREYQGFTDEELIGGYALEAVTKLFEAGIINGMDNGAFEPLGKTTRAQAAYILNLIMDA